MAVTNVAWVLDHHTRPVLALDLDGHPARIRSSQRTELLGRGIVEGMVFLTSERAAQFPNAFLSGEFGPALSQADLLGCTDDPRVFALYEQMCRAIADASWRPGPPAPRRDQDDGTP